MRRISFAKLLGLVLALAGGCAVEMADEAPVGQQSAALRTDRGGNGGGGGGGGGGKTTTTSLVLEADAFAVEQIEFLDEGGMSAWGALVVDPAGVARQSGVDDGFVSVRSKLGWVVHNLPIHAHPEAFWPEAVKARGLRAPTSVPPVRTYFDIGSDTLVREVELAVIFTSQPLNDSRELRKWEKATLLPIQVALHQQTQPTGIAVPPPSGLPPQPPPPPPVLAPEPIEPQLGIQNWYSVMQPASQNVNAANNQCAPAAFANGLAYLADTFGLNVTQPNIRSINGGPGLVGILDMLSQRPVTTTCSGSPLSYCLEPNSNGGMFNGLYAYLDSQGLENDVVFEHQGVANDLPADCPTIGQQDPLSSAAGSAVTLPWILAHLEQGDAVLLGFVRLVNTQQGEQIQSGHMLRIYGYSEVNGQVFLMALDDQQQDSLNNQFCTQRDDGLTWESWAVGDSDNDGTLNKGLNNLREITFGMAIGMN